MTEHEDTPKRGPGRPRKEHDDNGEEAKAKGTMVTYRPVDPGDPVTTTWAGEDGKPGVEFEANVPKRVLRKDIVEMAKGNPWFEVEGHPRAKRTKPTAEPVGPPGTDVEPVALDDRKMVEGHD